MNHNSMIRRCMIILLAFSFLDLVRLRFIPCGYLKVEPGTSFPLGSNLTVWCHVTKCPGWLNWFDISLKLNSVAVVPLRRVNHTTVIFRLPKVETPNSTVICKVDQLSRIVNGLDLHAALPPEKPRNVACETTNSSEIVECSWRKGWDAHCPTYYNISVYGENGTRIYLDQIKLAEKTSLPKRMFDTNTKYTLTITAHNDFGVSESEPFTLCIRDTVIPNVPQITLVEFKNDSGVAILCWKTSELSANLRPDVRLRTHNITWAVREGRVLSERLIQTDNLKPLTEYEFQIRLCESAEASTHNMSHTTTRTRCSKWSSSVKKTSPGKAPSHQLDVWRVLHTPRTRGMRLVTVLWKPPPPEDYSGEVQMYKISWASEQEHEVSCSSDAVQWTGQVSVGVQTLTVIASTSYGTTPPARVTLTHSDILGPALGELTPSLSGRGLLVSWSWPADSRRSTLEAELLSYVMEWTSVPGGQLQWDRLSKDLKNTTISGLTAGVGYRISLHAVTSRGVGAPSSRLAYSSEKTPVSGPEISVLAHDSNSKILIQWDELPVHQQRGNITKYTVYIHKLDSTKTVFNVTVSASGPRQMWLDCPPGALVLQMTASTSAGEGPPGKPVSSEPAVFTVDLVIVAVFVIAVLIAITANLMCCSCIRERIKQKCISWGPGWFVDNMPNVGHSNAIRLLKREENEPLFSSSDSETPLSPITVVSQEAKEDVYPTIHSVTQIESEQHAVDTIAGSTLEHFDYKPQTATFGLQSMEVNDQEDQESDSPTHRGEEDGCIFVFGELTGGLLLDGIVDFLDSPPGLAHSSVSGLVRPTTVETAEQSVRADFLSLEDVTTPDTTDTRWSQHTSEVTLNDGYFPQVVAAGSNMV